MLSTEFIGRLHSLIAHIPIGILLFAFALLCRAISATMACVAGWFLAQSGEYDANLVFKH